jgi:hypothetical protein
MNHVLVNVDGSVQRLQLTSTLDGTNYYRITNIVTSSADNGGEWLERRRSVPSSRPVYLASSSSSSSDGEEVEQVPIVTTSVTPTVTPPSNSTFAANWSHLSNSAQAALRDLLPETTRRGRGRPRGSPNVATRSVRRRLATPPPATSSAPVAAAAPSTPAEPEGPFNCSACLEEFPREEGHLCRHIHGRVRCRGFYCNEHFEMATNYRVPSGSSLPYIGKVCPLCRLNFY